MGKKEKESMSKRVEKRKENIMESAPDLVIKCSTKLFSFKHAACHTPMMPKYKGT